MTTQAPLRARTICAATGMPWHLHKQGLGTRQVILDELLVRVQKTPLTDLTVIGLMRGTTKSPATFYQYFPGLKEAAAELAKEIRASGGVLPENLVDQKARADALAAAIKHLHERIHQDLPDSSDLARYADGVVSSLEKSGKLVAT